jgi:type I restriction enzyme S subunit
MKLSKNKWVNKYIEDVCENIFAGGDVPKNNFSHAKTAVFDTPIYSNGEKDKGLYGYTDIKKVTIPSITISARGTIGYSEIREEAFFPIVRLIVLTPNRKLLDIYFLRFVIGNLSFASVGTSIPQLTVPMVKQVQIPLPPLEEQKQIAALFQSIEAAMEQVDGQEKNLKALQKSLVNGLLSKEPEFGNLLNSKNCTATTFGEIAECDKKYPEHEREVVRFVGLEFIEADNFQLQGWGEIANGTTFSKRFVKGDVLFGKRRAYLKKVAVADFDGICSGDILVIRAKAKKILQGLLPYYISADAFIQHAVSTSAGSLSPRTKWKDLAELEVCIPDIKIQSNILEVLQQLDNTVNQLKQQKTTLKNLKQKLLNEILG